MAGSGCIAFRAQRRSRGDCRVSLPCDLNRGNHFEAVELPAEAQFAPALGVCVADLDGDGNEDVFLSQNFFAMTPDERRLDAGRGLWLRGNGTGDSRPCGGKSRG